VSDAPGVQPADIYPPQATVGLAITTFAAAPHVHLHLEARRRFYPDVPLLVHDDGSDVQPQLAQLCADYGVEFRASGLRRGHHLGDVGGIYAGLKWAEEKRFDLLAKFSRRFIPLHDWRPDLLRLAHETQARTFNNVCLNINWGFRTEALAMHIPSWIGVLPLFEKELATRAPSLWYTPGGVVCEKFVHGAARKVAATAKWKDDRPRWCNGYAPWGILGDNRRIKVPNVLWHHSSPANAYYELALQWGLPYQRGDFFAPHLRA